MAKIIKEAGKYSVVDIDFAESYGTDLSDDELEELQPAALENGEYLNQLEREHFFHYCPVVFHTPGDAHESHWRRIPSLDKASQAMLRFIHG